jgi:cysteine desulfurase family protein (TIGR01976 family)
MSFNLETIRSQFPALAETDDGTRRIYLDNPAGTQVPQSVAERMVDCLLKSNANLGGYFRTAKLADEVVENAHAAMADLLNAKSPDEIVFGQNMTTITLHMSRSIGLTMSPGDELILSQMDHDANVQPWVLLARDLNLKIRWLPFDKESFEFDLTKLDELLNERTKLVCVGAASNLTGTINDVQAICRKAREAGAWSYIDAVQAVPHIETDVQKMGCDFLVCSAYKFFGPHQGILWGRLELLEQLEPYRVRPASSTPPGCYETGTQSHEGLAGTAAAVDYFASVGETMASAYHSKYADFPERRKHVHAAMDCLFEYERGLAQQLIDGLQSIRGVTVQGISSADAQMRRVPTVSFTHDKIAPAAIAEALAQRNIFVWNGHNYAVEAAKLLGIYDSGGAVRVGPVHYNSRNEISELLNAVDEILS